jgi:hypothetical protein
MRLPQPLQFAALIAIVACFTNSSSFAAQDDSIDLNLKYERGQQHRVQLEFRHEGKVIIQQDANAEPAEDSDSEGGFRTLPMKTAAKLGYHQRFTGKGGEIQAIRFYDQAKGRYEIHTGKTGADLANENRLVVVRVKSQKGKRVQMASVMSTLAQGELELLRNPVDPLSIASLINRDDVVKGEKWQPSDDGLANFLAVDRILRNDVKIYWKDVRKNSARIYITGKLRAAIDDVTTDLELSSIVTVKLGTKQELVGANLNIREIRQPGQVAPGFDGRTSISMTSAVDKTCQHLTNKSLAKYTKGRVIEQRLKWESPGLKLKYDPRWRVIASQDEAAIMRFVSNGELLAQCNIVQLPARPADKPLTKEEYRKEVARIIAADEVAQIVDVQEFQANDSVRALKVEVEGVEEDVPVSWLYYHVNDRDGRRMTFVFTLERQVLTDFRPADKKMVEGLVFEARDRGQSSAANRAARTTAPAKKASTSGARR